MSFHQRLRRLREKKGLTWYRLAQLSGISKQGVQKLEQPGHDPSLSTLRKLARAFAMSLDELAGEDDCREPKRTPRGNRG